MATKKTRRKKPRTTKPGAGALAHIAPDLRDLAVPIASVKVDPHNARTHSARNLEAIRRSLERFGQREPIVVQKRGKIVRAGNARLEAARSLEWSHVAVVFVDDDDVTATAYGIASNRTGELAGWDEEQLVRLLRELDAEDAQLLDVVGYSEREIDKLIREAGDLAGQSQEQEPKIALPENPRTQAGDVWQLGEHRVMCGDCTNKNDVATLMDGAKPLLLVADPPYCSGGFQEAQKAAGTFGDIAADNLSARGYQSLIRRMIEAARPQVVYLFCDWRMWVVLFDVVESSGLAVRNMLVWNKGTPGLGSLWRMQHELIMFANRETSKRQKGKPAIGNVITTGRTGNNYHYTEKPVDLLKSIIDNDANSQRDAVHVYDPMAGSGPTLLAAEHSGRMCYAMEIEPKFVDVLVGRWENLTGKKAKKRSKHGNTKAKVEAP